MKDNMIDQVRDYCLENKIQLSNAPQFVNEMLETTIPFKNAKRALQEKFNYINEWQNKQRTLDNLPDTIKGKIYEF